MILLLRGTSTTILATPSTTISSSHLSPLQANTPIPPKILAAQHTIKQKNVYTPHNPNTATPIPPTDNTSTTPHIPPHSPTSSLHMTTSHSPAIPPPTLPNPPSTTINTDPSSFNILHIHRKTNDTPMNIAPSPLATNPDIIIPIDESSTLDSNEDTTKNDSPATIDPHKINQSTIPSITPQIPPSHFNINTFNSHVIAHHTISLPSRCDIQNSPSTPIIHRHHNPSTLNISTTPH